MSEDTPQPSARFVEGGLQFRFPRGHPAITVVARLMVVCPRHTGEIIGEYHLHADGSTTGANQRGVQSEYITEEPIDPEVLADLPPYLRAPTAALSDPGDVPHARFRFQCPKPSCPVDMQIRADGDKGLRAIRNALLAQMLEAGIPELAVTNIDGDPWRVVYQSE
jgi:hypothetical protein